ncbi:helix-turn-helix domain-containing protein [Microbacterium sp. BLY]|uniref:helix-turn-helix domain-containing protein n=1 Tax=Microbacterium sp. BLY TaxID=2823280 RepID=UPI001B31FCD8|nr:helix-turn-helix transcriptional regulator [Microbacterium sp. BLY]MBP3977846.1 helix-turn-helix transcriptional regulator [Microbacterium sp. BLY]
MTLTDKELGENVRRFRGDMSQKALAERMNELGARWSQPTVAAIERGERSLKFTEVTMLSEALQLPIGHFVSPGIATEVLQRARATLVAHDQLKAAIRAYENTRLQLAATLDSVAPDDVTNHQLIVGESWVERGVLDVIEEMREEQGIGEDGDQGASGHLADPEGHPWMTRWAEKYSGAGIDG